MDANPLFAALLGGKALKIIYDKQFHFITTEHTIWEVKKYIRELAKTVHRKSGKNKGQRKKEAIERELNAELEKFPLEIIHPQYYSHKIEQSKILIGSRDITDIDILALSLTTRFPLWSNDKDFEGIEEIELLRTEDMLRKFDGL